MTRPHKDWFQFARADLAFARKGLKDGFFRHVCFLAQQATEKALKGFLVYKDRDYPRTHDLTDLHGILDVSWLDAHLSALKLLSGFYIPFRYPDAYAEVTGRGSPDKRMASKILSHAEEIVDLIESHCR